MTLVMKVSLKYDVLLSINLHTCTLCCINCKFFPFFLEFDGLFLSNGPGNPQMCSETIKNLRNLLKKSTAPGDRRVPVFGICLGHQLLSLAAGTSSYKMK